MSTSTPMIPLISMTGVTGKEQAVKENTALFSIFDFSVTSQFLEIPSTPTLSPVCWSRTFTVETPFLTSKH